MTDKLAGLVLPDATPVETAPEQPEEPSPATRPGLLERVAGHFSGDWPVIGSGIALAAVCAVFPWYIFFHQEEFGVRPLKFSGRESGLGGGSAQPELAGERLSLTMENRPQLDFIPTGTVSDTPQFDEDLPNQPYPGDRLAFQLVHAGNGRAMIEDSDGFWIVQRGSALPDGSRVAQILQRDGTWVLVTSLGAEVTLARP